MKRTQRINIIVKKLSDAPGRVFSLGYFCDMTGAAKSSISEDIVAAKEILAESGTGYIVTMPGAAGGVMFAPYISDEMTAELQKELCEKLSDGSRILGGGFLYTSDIMFDPYTVSRVATVFARRYADLGADYVATIETKGIPVAFMTARLLGRPLVVVRREAKVSEGSTISINYFSGSSDRIQKMSIAKRAVVPGRKALVIDDFMRAGGSASGIQEILAEAGVETAGTGIVIVAEEPVKKKVENYNALLFLGNVDEEKRTVDVFPNSQIF